jgi:hypothetical protein
MKVASKNLKDLFVAEEKAVDEAMQNAVEHALMIHKRAGNSIASWKDGKVVIIPAEEIPMVDKTGKRRK